MQEKFTFNIETPRFKKKMILFKEELESREHVVLKLLAYVIFYDERLKIEFSIGTHYKPDLVIEGDHGVPELWIDCGKITLKKVEGVTSKFKRTKIIILKKGKTEAVSLKKLSEKRVDSFENLQFLYFDRGVVDGIADVLDRSNDLMVWDVTENTLGLAFGEHTFETVIHYA